MKSAWRMALLCVAHCAVAHSTALRTPFIDVVMDVSVGKQTRVISGSGDGLFLYNPGNEPVDVQIDFRVPLPEELKPGAEAIPDVRWAWADPPRVSIPAQGSVRVPIWIQVAPQREFRHRTFQVMMISRMIPNRKQVIAVQAGLKSTIRLIVK